MLKSAVLRIANLIGETGCYRFLSPETVPVFVLHRIYDGEETVPGATSVEILRSFLTYLKEHDYRVLTVDELYDILSRNIGISHKTVMFTVDDGFWDQYEHASAVFGEFGYPLNYFVIPDFLDGRLWPWDVQITYAFTQSRLERVKLTLPSGQPKSMELKGVSPRINARKLRDELKYGPQSYLYKWIKAELYSSLNVRFPDDVPSVFRAMSWDNARELKNRGHGVYPHTCTHRILSSLTVQERWREISDSQKRVEQELGDRPTVFAYPTGRPTDYGQTDVDFLTRCGFKVAFTTVPDYVRRGQKLLELPRFSLPENLIVFQQILNRLEAFKSRLRA